MRHLLLLPLLLLSLPAPAFELLTALGPAGEITAPRPLPFAALVELDRQGGACSAGNVGHGQILTAAHCFADSRNLGNFALAFLDLSGRLRWARPLSFLYLGRPDFDDIAVLGISAESAAQWPTAPLLPFPRASHFDATVWAFDPVPLRPELARRYGPEGVVLRPRHCRGGTRKPLILGIPPHGAPTSVVSSKAHEGLDLFLDTCDAPFLPGNSGALITSGASLTVLGVAHSGLTLTAAELRTFLRYRVRDVDGHVHTLTPAEAAMGELFHFGTWLEPWVAGRPGVLRLPASPL